jgi:hypothetical protein
MRRRVAPEGAAWCESKHGFDKIRDPSADGAERKIWRE